MNKLFSSLLLFTALLPANAMADKPGDKTRLTLGVPAYVYHPDERTAPEGWNDGWFNNEGVFADLTWQVMDLGKTTNLRAGVTGGVFDNSMFKTSVFFGGAVEIETYATQNLSFSLGSYAGAITGYENDVSPAIAPYVGTTYAFTEQFEMGLRGYWLPAQTIAGSDMAESDAYVAAFTVGTRF